MSRLRKGKNEIPKRGDVEVLATLLVAYPEVSRATFDPAKKTLGMVFLCRGPLSVAARKGLIEAYIDSVEVYGALIGTKTTFVKAYWEKMERFYCFYVERDVASLSPGELGLTVELVANGARVVPATESSDAVDNEEEYTWSARVFLQEMLEQVRSLESPRKLVALREGERVLVFDK